MMELERWQLEGPNPSSALPTGTGELRVLSGTDARGISMPVSRLRLADGAKPAGVGPDTEPLLSQVPALTATAQGDIGAPAATWL